MSRPLVVIKGDATPEEIAAVLAVLQAASSAAEPPAPVKRSEWSAHHRKLRTTYAHGPNAWRASAFPR